MTQDIATPNEMERQRWNDDYWTSMWPRREEMTGEATAPLLERLAPRPGERLLEVGSGAGRTAIVAAGLVGPEGSVLGADFSAQLVEYSSREAAAASVANVGFVVADVQCDALPDGPFDAAYSQFGVMFFEDPVAAFANVRAHVAVGGRFAFACWRSPAENPWFIGHSLRDFVDPPPPPAPGHHATGPFALADRTDVDGLLDAAGWRGVEWTSVDLIATVEVTTIVDERQPSFLGVPDDRVADARAAIDRQLAPFAQDDGRLAVPLALQIATARNPG